MIPPTPPKARGAADNPKPRFDRLETVAFDDGWSEEMDEVSAPATSVSLEPARSIISTNDSPDIFFNQSINPYRGCEHGCVYCFARPSHAYLGLSPGLDFETKLIAKPNAAELLARELARPGYRCQVLAVGTNTDPYQPIENRLRIMRACLEVMVAFRQPVAITTKSFLVTRDKDLLATMARQGLANVAISVTTLDRDLSRHLEPRAATPAKRLEAIRLLATAGVPVTVSVAPVIPFLTDHEMESILMAAREAGATSASTILLRLPHEVKDLFEAWLRIHAPAKRRHILSLMRQHHDGRLYRSEFGKRFAGSGNYAELQARRFTIAKRKLGYNERSIDLDCSRFQRPLRPGDQLALFPPT
jgi:DNA repair photolyase